MTKPWYGSPWVRLGGLVLLAAVIAAAAIPFLVPVDRFRPLLTRLLADTTGRDVRIGTLRLYLAPTVHIHAGDVRMKNPQGFPPGDAITIRSVDLGVAPRALLSRRLDVTHVALSGIRLNLLQDRAGRTNFDFSAPPRSGPAGRTTAPAEGVAFLTLDRIGTVTVKNVGISISSLDPRRGQETPSFSLSGVNGQIRSIDPRAPAWASALDIIVHLKGARLTAPVLARPVQFPAGDIFITGSAGRAAFSASVDGMRAEVTAAASLNPLSITFTAALPELDVSRLQTLVTNAAQGDGSKAAPPAPLARQRLLASGEIKIDRLVLPPLTATRWSSRLRVYSSAIHIPTYSLSAYGGTIQGTAALDSSTAGQPAGLTAKVSGIDLKQVGDVLMPSARRITGTLEATLTLSTALGRGPKSALAGAGAFAVRNGSFPGLDLKSSLAQLARALNLNVPAGPTKFTYFGGDVRVSRDRVSSDTLRLEADDLEGTATGSVGFDKTLDYVGTGTLKTLPSGAAPAAGALPSAGQVLGALLPGAGGATGVRVPFSLRGTLEDPKFSLAGTPQLLRGASTQPQQPPSQQPGPLLPGLPDLFKLFP